MRAFFIFILQISILNSCKNPQELILRKWKFESYGLDIPKRNLNDFEKTVQNRFEVLNAEMRKSVTFEFKKNETYEFIMPERSEQGKWFLSKDNKKLITTDIKGKSDTSNIDKLTSLKLVMSQNKDGKTMIIKLKK